MIYNSTCLKMSFWIKSNLGFDKFIFWICQFTLLISFWNADGCFSGIPIGCRLYCHRVRVPLAHIGRGQPQRVGSWIFCHGLFIDVRGSHRGDFLGGRLHLCTLGELNPCQARPTCLINLLENLIRPREIRTTRSSFSYRYFS